MLYKIATTNLLLIKSFIGIHESNVILSLSNKFNIIHNLIPECLDIKWRCIEPLYKTNRDYLYICSFECINLVYLTCESCTFKSDDFRLLTNVKELTLNMCYNITHIDIDGLNNLKSLKIHRCYELTLVKLNNSSVENVELVGCSNLIEVNIPNSVISLDLSDSSSIETLVVPQLSNLTSLKVNECKKLNMNSLIKSFPYLEKLSLCGCNVTDVEPYSYILYLYLSECKYISNLRSLKNILVLNISYTNITDVSVLSGLKILDISHCYNVTDVSSLNNLKTLHMAHCYNVTNVDALFNVSELNIEGCYKITSIKKLFYKNKITSSYKRLVNSDFYEQVKINYPNPNHVINSIEITKCYGLKKLSALLYYEQNELNEFESMYGKLIKKTPKRLIVNMPIE